MAQHTLDAAGRSVPGFFFEYGFDGLCLDRIVLGSARAVGIDVIDVFITDAGIFKCRRHSLGGTPAIFVHVSDAEGIGAAAVADYFCKDFDAAFLRRAQGLKNNYRRTFAKYETVSARSKRS